MLTLYKTSLNYRETQEKKMIALNVKQENSSSSPLSLSTPQEEPTISFSELLKGAGKKDGKVIQNGSLVLALESDEKEAKSSSKKDTLLGLLKNNDKELCASDELIALNPKLSENMSSADIKALVADAKNYLKSKILSSEDFKKSQIKDLPKTLKGLAEMAKQFGIDLSKITMEEVQSKGSNVAKTLDTKKEVKSDKKDTPVDADGAELQKTIKNENTKTEIKSTPLFKAQTQSKEITTEQIVQNKVAGTLKTEDKNQKSRADETLKLLLRGEKPSHSSANLTADFSVATAKVIAPKATDDATKSLEKLLHGDSKEESKTNSKIDGLATHKTADSFEVKLNEAKQMIKYLSNDVKNAIEDYKAPFTRVKVQLNPQKLGEVDLTIVQRGKNLHVNISSNNTAINTLSMNANELRTQLNNNGINNASLNFNDGSNNPGSNQQQGKRENEKHAHEEYNYFENEENNEEILSSLEIVVPHYA